jgi:uncharacterized Zn finger protein (UPF0148 family)
MVHGVRLAVSYHAKTASEGMTNAFCVKERKNREMTATKNVVFKNGRKAIRGKCSHCGTTLFRITGK